MAWDSVVAAEDIITSTNHNAMITDQKARAPVTSGSGSPSSTPSRICALYVDTTNFRLYFAKGTASSADWEQVLST